MITAKDILTVLVGLSIGFLTACTDHKPSYKQRMLWEHLQQEAITRDFRGED